MVTLIRIIGLEGFATQGNFDVAEAVRRGENIWLKSFDVDAFGGRGEAKFTDSVEEALRFADLGAAFEAWKTESKVLPLRPDGKPNRPLTAFSITFDTVED